LRFASARQPLAQALVLTLQNATWFHAVMAPGMKRQRLMRDIFAVFAAR